MRRKNSLNELATQGRIRNRLLSAKTMQAEIRAAAARVKRLSDPGTPERSLTLMAVADDTRLNIADIVDALVALAESSHDRT